MTPIRRGMGFIVCLLLAIGLSLLWIGAEWWTGRRIGAGDFE